MSAIRSNPPCIWSVLGQVSIECCAGQVKVADKSNEITAIPALLQLLDITGCIITIDAMGTQTEIARQIVTKGADYVLCLKANHPTLCAQVKAWFEGAQSRGYNRSTQICQAVF